MESDMFTPEQLENRRLLSVAVKFDPNMGQLNVYGVGKENQIRVTMVNTESTAGGTIKLANTPVSFTKPGSLLQGVTVYDGLKVVFATSTMIKQAAVRNVDVYGEGGADQITLYAWNSQTTSRVFAGGGDDAVYATANQASLAKVYGGDGNDFMNLTYSDGATFQGPDAGAGNDTINVLGSRIYDLLPGTLGCDLKSRVILGGDGNDVINASMEFGLVGSFGYMVMAGAGDDVITGSSQSDQLFGEDGNDDVDAGAGDDYLNGGLGDDTICGEDGNDFLDHGGGTDLVDGGNGFDTGIAGKEDELIDMEELM